jgi:microcystin degradation protein MlrC
MNKTLAFLFFVVTLPLSAQSQKPLIAIAGISHESNSFNVHKTKLEDFYQSPDVPRDQFITEAAKTNTTVSGYIEGSKRFGLNLHPTVVVRAQPKGPVTDHAFNTLSEKILQELKAAPKLDGIFLALHGAMVVESYPSGDAELTRRVREAMGPDIPIIVTHDFHANVTPEIVEHSNVLITYKENPHLDTKERGIQAARIMADMVRGKAKPTQVVVKPPMMYNIVYQYTSVEPLAPIVQESRNLEENPKILAVSVSGGYQYADVPWMGPSVVVATDNDLELAQREAQRLSDMLWGTRDRLALKVPTPAEAVKKAMEGGKFPAVLIDMGDNIGGGTPGDSTFILDELIKQKAEGWVVVMADPEATKQAFKLGIGGAFDMEVGGKTDHMHGKPVRVRGRVRSLHEGRYVEPEVRHGGRRYWEMGHTAVILVEGSTLDMPNLVLLTMRRSSPNSLHQLISNGVYPERQKILVAKGCIAPRAAYEPIAGVMIEVDSPGATAVNPARFEYKRVRQPLFGLK